MVKTELKDFMENGFILFTLSNEFSTPQSLSYCGDIHFSFYFKSNKIWVYQPVDHLKGKTIGYYSSISLLEQRIPYLNRIYANYQAQFRKTALRIPVSAFAFMMGDIQECVKYQINY